MYGGYSSSVSLNPLRGKVAEGMIARGHVRSLLDPAPGNRHGCKLLSYSTFPQKDYGGKQVEPISFLMGELCFKN